MQKTKGAESTGNWMRHGETVNKYSIARKKFPLEDFLKSRIFTLQKSLRIVQSSVSPSSGRWEKVEEVAPLAS